MTKAHALCALLPLIFVMPDVQHSAPHGGSPAAADNQFEGMCRRLATRIGDEIELVVVFVDGR